MQLNKYLSKDNILILSTTQKDEVFKELIKILVSVNSNLNPKELSKALFRREKMMSTGIGNGLAIPHVRLEGINNPTIAIGVSHEGIKDYDSLDDIPIHIIVMIVAPVGNHEAYLKLLALSAEALKKKELRQKITESEDPEQIFNILIKSK